MLLKEFQHSYLYTQETGETAKSANAAPVHTHDAIKALILDSYPGNKVLQQPVSDQVLCTDAAQVKVVKVLLHM